MSTSTEQQNTINRKAFIPHRQQYYTKWSTKIMTPKVFNRFPSSRNFVRDHQMSLGADYEHFKKGDGKITKIPVLFTSKVIPQRIYDPETKTVKYEGFDVSVPESSLNKFEYNISTTTKEYVYPTVFTSLCQKAYISDESLYKLRVWANVYRLTYDKANKEYNDYYIYRLYIRTLDIGKETY